MYLQHRKRAHTETRTRFSTHALPVKSRPGQPVYADAGSGGVSSCYSRFTRCERHIHVVPMGGKNKGKSNGGRTLEGFCNGFQCGF